MNAVLKYINLAINGMKLYLIDAFHASPNIDQNDTNNRLDDILHLLDIMRPDIARSERDYQLNILSTKAIVRAKVESIKQDMASAIIQAKLQKAIMLLNIVMVLLTIILVFLAIR